MVFALAALVATPHLAAQPAATPATAHPDAGAGADQPYALTNDQLMDLALRTQADGRPELAAGLYQRSCDGGHLMACQRLGEMFITSAIGRDVVPGPETRYSAFGTDPAYDVASDLFARACDGGMLQSCAILSRFYREGRETAQNDARTLVLLNKACTDARGSDGAALCVDLATIYRDGMRVAPDAARARTLYRRACDLRLSSACAMAEH